MGKKKVPNGKSPRKGKPAPKCKALLFCNRFITDSQTGMTSIIDIINTLWVTKLPARTSPFYIFLHLVGGVGTYNFRVEIRSLTDNKPMATATINGIAFPDRLNILQFALPCPGFPVDHAGPYDVVVLADGKDVERERVMVGLASQPGKMLESSDETDDEDTEYDDTDQETDEE